jgi:transcriptional regulator GlxA family with amidase domain
VAGLPLFLDLLPLFWHAVVMLNSVAVLVYDGVAPFELGMLCEAFGQDRTDRGAPSFDFMICAPRPGRVATSVPGFAIEVPSGLTAALSADLVCVPAMPWNQQAPDSVLETLRAAYARGARLLSVCSGAFVLGQAGLLDGRACTTHWRHVCALQEQFPRALVECDVLYVDDGRIVTSAGSAAGLDACLHLFRSEFGASVATTVARGMVVAPHRDGGQAQFIDSPIPQTSADTLQPVLDWMAAHLGSEISVEELARRALMSPRTFARRFRAETGTTPYHWLTNQRVLYAERMLEQTDETVERIAALAGFGNATALRHHFGRLRGTNPQHYRRSFRGPKAARSA